MKLGEVIVTYNSNDANMQTITIVNSHHITEAQYVFFSNTRHCNGEIWEEKGKRKWLRIYTWFATCLNETKKGGETSNQKFFEFIKGEYRDRQHA